MNNDPLVAENFLFRTRTGNPTKKSGQDIIKVCHDVLSRFAEHHAMEVRLIKTYRTREVFVPCLAMTDANRHIVDTHPMTLYVRPGLRNLSRGFKPDQKYDRLFVASGAVAGLAQLESDTLYDNVNTSIELVREVRNELARKLGGKLLKRRRPRCVLCNEWIVRSNPDEPQSLRPSCSRHGINPPTWLDVDDRPMPPPAGVAALLVPA